MSTNTSLSEDFGKLRDEWMELDPTLRFLDLISIFLVALFGIGYILINVFDIKMTVSNDALLIFPLILAGYTFVLSSKLGKEEYDNSQAKKEFYILVGMTLGLVILTFIYSIILNQVLIN